MSEKRKDNKNRILRTGESQRKDGTYMYRYNDIKGNRRCVYAKDLNSLRDKEKEIQRDIEDGIDNIGGEMTFLELFDEYVDTRQNVRCGTKKNYNIKRNHLINSGIQNKPINKITVKDVNLFAKQLQSNQMAYSTYRIYISTFKSIFNYAVEMDYVRKNPFVLKNPIADKQSSREALTEQEENNLLNLLKLEKDDYYYNLSQFILLTGVRIGEALGLTWKDIDFVNKTIRIEKQMGLGEHGQYIITDTKTKYSHRELYMYTELYEFLKGLATKKINNKIEYIIDGYSDFIFISKTGRVPLRTTIRNSYKKIREKYEKKYNVSVYISPHVLRHTFCTRMIQKGLNVKTVQYYMGHSKIDITLNIYSHVNKDTAADDIKRHLG